MCVTKAEYIPILEQAHARLLGENFSSTTIAKAIMTSRLWWPTLFEDAEEFVKRCDACQCTKTPIQEDNMPLRPIIGACAFAKWGIDFFGHTNPLAYRTRAQYIIVATYYLIKWVDTKPTPKNDARTTTCFLY